MELDGVQVGRQIREQLGNNKISIVYISSKETYAMSLFQVRPLDFLIKPLTKEKVAATLEQFIRLSEANKNEFYYHAGKSVCRLYLDEIRYFACNGRKVEICTGSGQKEFYGAMREVWEQVEGKVLSSYWRQSASAFICAVFLPALESAGFLRKL